MHSNRIQSYNGYQKKGKRSELSFSWEGTSEDLKVLSPSP